VTEVRKVHTGSTLTQWIPLFLISGCSLLFELAVIRWISGEVRLFAYLKNVPLLAAFLGLAVGYVLVDSGRDQQSAFAPLLGLFVVLVLAVGRISSPRALAYPSPGDEFLWYTAPFSYWLSLGLFLGVVLLFFLAIMLLFIPLGQAVGKEMVLHDPVPAYIVNIVGSLAGVWLFALLSYTQVPPVAWFGVGLVGVGVYLGMRRRLSLTTLAVFAAVLVGLLVSNGAAIWSPYQRLEVTDLYLSRQDGNEPVRVGYHLSVQQIFYQMAVDLSPEALTRMGDQLPEMRDMAFMYDLPYRLAPKGSQVLIVGAGLGNDVAAALRQGAARVDAVEIDPAILALGRKLHSERPYDDPRVTPIVDDARSFFEKSREQYDVIAFGLLDSHTLLSSFSSVRLDSFVYTLESFEEVKQHLAEHGIVAMTFVTTAPWMQERLGRMLVHTFGPDLVFYREGGGGTTFVAGQLTDGQLKEAQLKAWDSQADELNLPLATDDWPYLYMRTRKIPGAYWQAFLAIGIVCLGLFASAFPGILRPDWRFWLLGTAFLLIEFKSITELALLFGTTWFVNALAISGVLTMSLAANLVVLWRKRVNLRLAYLLLFGSLSLSYILPLDWFIRFGPMARAVASPFVLSLPLFFAGLIFSESLRRARETARPLASNLSGTFAGGLLEYGSIWWGIKSLYLVAGLVYLGAFMAGLVHRE
jgi:spermidine synthase